MAVAEWTETMDASLLHQRRDQKLGWRLVRIEGATRKQCQERFAFLTSGRDRPVVRMSAAEAQRNEDGLDRLVRKGRLSGPRLTMARHYRMLGRLATAGGGDIKSCLNHSPGGGARLGLPGGGEAFEVTAAKREMFDLRWNVLKGQSDVLTALDGVLISGHTLLYLAGGAGKGARAAELMLALVIGLDMMIAARGGQSASKAA